MTISDDQTFSDFWQFISERNAVDEILAGAGTNITKALEGIATDEEINNHIHYNIQPLEINEKTEKKIIKSMGGINGIKKFMAYSAEWNEYKNELEVQ